MAFRAVMQKNWRSPLIQLGGGRRSFATPTIDASHRAHKSTSRMTLKAELTPVYIVGGMVVLACSMAAHSCYQQLVHSPTVHVNKNRRETMPEVFDPDRTVGCATKFIDGSFLRKVAHIQESNPAISDPAHPNPFTRPRNVETLKTVGIETTRR